jgi:hypothetical protein
MAVEIQRILTGKWGEKVLCYNEKSKSVGMKTQ